MPSSIPAARLALFNMLDAAPALATAQTTYGPPEAHSEERKVVAILGVESIATEEVNVGGEYQEESYAINLRAKVWDPSCNGSATELQAIDAEIWGFYETVRATVKADRTLGGALTAGGSGRAIVATAGEGQGSGESPVPAVDDNDQPAGWVAFCDMRVLCTARIT